MKNIGFLLAAMIVASCATLPEPSDNCAIPKVETDKLLTLSFEAFDQDQAGGWRGVERQDGCELRTAHLIRDYLAKNDKILDPNMTRVTRWHLGQMWANAGKPREAISAFEFTKEPGNDSHNYYADATIAFLKRDRAALDRARAGLLLVPKPRGYDEAMVRFQQQYNLPPPVWPSNLDVIDRLGRCFDSSYKVAYGGSC